MTDAQTRVTDLSREESIHLLQDKSFVGRVGFMADGAIQVLPVNYLAEDDAIYFCTADGTMLSAVGGGVAVAFEVDASQPMYHSGWSVLVHGTAHEVTDTTDLERLRRGPLKSWALTRPQHWVRITIDAISGRQIPAI